ncbi:hypothetical protein EJ07DRAFT_156950 [Lizonia empirigonia]|nr:hypothetical protein EJ07DRAFT_156950 [Lizonia empirigonia]
MSFTGNRRVNRAASFDSLPRFTKSPTISTTSSQSTQFSGLHSFASAAVHRKDVEVSPGEFSMPRVPKRSRRGTDGSARSSRSDGRKKKDSFEAHAYGRHSNQWLFKPMPSRKATGRCLEGTTKIKDEGQQHDVRFDIAQAVAKGLWILQLNNFNTTINITPDLTLMYLCLYHLLDVNALFKFQR